MKIRVSIIISFCLLLVACAKVPYNDINTANANHEAYLALAEAADSVSQSLTQLGETEQAAYPPININIPPDPSVYGMQIPSSIDWNGPIEPLIQQIANATSYKLKILGKSPAIPVIVSISAHDTSMGDILRNIGYQGKNRAHVVIFPSTRTIELRYAVT